MTPLHICRDPINIVPHLFHESLHEFYLNIFCRYTRNTARWTLISICVAGKAFGYTFVRRKYLHVPIQLQYNISYMYTYSVIVRRNGFCRPYGNFPLNCFHSGHLIGWCLRRASTAISMDGQWKIICIYNSGGFNYMYIFRYQCSIIV